MATTLRNSYNQRSIATFLKEGAVLSCFFPDVQHGIDTPGTKRRPILVTGIRTAYDEDGFPQHFITAVSITSETYREKAYTQFDVFIDDHKTVASLGLKDRGGRIKACQEIEIPLNQAYFGKEIVIYARSTPQLYRDQVKEKQAAFKAHRDKKLSTSHKGDDARRKHTRALAMQRAHRAAVQKQQRHQAHSNP